MAGYGPRVRGVMCGRFTQGFSWDDLIELFGPLDSPPVDLRPRYNVAPGQPVAAIRDGPNRRRLAMLRWGLVPPWAADPGSGHRFINARAETVREKPAFRAAFRARRCIIPADGFFEWRREGERRQPWLFAMGNRRPFALAGLWESWTAPPEAGLPGLFDDQPPSDPLETCTIVTTEANDVVRPVHHRMPVILASGAARAWLAGGDVPLVPFPDSAMTSVRVSTMVNSARHDDLRCIEPVAAG